MGPMIIAIIDPIITLSITKRITESDGGDNIQKPIIAINPPENPPKIPHFNRLFTFFMADVTFILLVNRALEVLLFLELEKEYDLYDRHLYKSKTVKELKLKQKFLFQ